VAGGVFYLYEFRRSYRKAFSQLEDS
jgi:hypothetical protein